MLRKEIGMLAMKFNTPIGYWMEQTEDEIIEWIKVHNQLQ